MWNANWYPAPSYLAHVLVGTWSVTADSIDDLEARVLPDGTSCIVFQRQDAELFTCGPGGSKLSRLAVSGPQCAGFDFRLGAGGQFFIAQLQPIGAAMVLGISMSRMAMRFEPLDAIVPDLAIDFVEQLLGESDELDSIAAIQNWIFSKSIKRVLHPLSKRTVSQISLRNGEMSINDIATQMNVSRRTILRVCHESIGFSPKLFSRLLRFDRAVKVSRGLPNSSWADIAQMVGYSDQAHLTREFKSLGGIRPSELRGPKAAVLW